MPGAGAPEDGAILPALSISGGRRDNLPAGMIGLCREPIKHHGVSLGVADARPLHRTWQLPARHGRTLPHAVQVLGDTYWQLPGRCSPADAIEALVLPDFVRLLHRWLRGPGTCLSLPWRASDVALRHHG